MARCRREGGCGVREEWLRDGGKWVKDMKRQLWLTGGCSFGWVVTCLCFLLTAFPFLQCR